MVESPSLSAIARQRPLITSCRTGHAPPEDPRGGDGRGRTFSVNLERKVFHCHDAQCKQQGDIIDLWAAWHRMKLRGAARDLVRTFDLEPCAGTEKRNG